MFILYYTFKVTISLHSVLLCLSQWMSYLNGKIRMMWTYRPMVRLEKGSVLWVMTGVWGIWCCEQVCERVWWSLVMSGWVTFPLHRIIYYGTLNTAGNGGADSIQTAGTPGETLYLKRTMNLSSFGLLPHIVFCPFWNVASFSNWMLYFLNKRVAFYLT